MNHLLPALPEHFKTPESVIRDFGKLPLRAGQMPRAVPRACRCLRKLVLLTSLGAIAFASHADYPERPVKLIVPFAPGTSTDAQARELAQVLSAMFRQPVIVDNRAGAEGNIGAKAVANAEPDGYTALLTTSSSAVLDGLMRKVPQFDPLKELAPVCGISSVGMGMYITSALPFKNVADFVAAAKAQPERFTFAYATASQRLAAELFQQASGVKLKGIPYRATVAGITAAASGEVDMVMNDPVGAGPLYAAGRIRPLAVSTPVRMKTLPDIPVGAEAGLPGFEMTPWWGMFLPAKTPAPVVETLRQAVSKALASQAMVASRTKMGVDEFSLCGDALTRFQVSDIDRWRQVIKKAAIPLE
ncbi:tripartite tricarboxylate transporter substrate binding protein [Variovorax guangxiensis]|uniref:Bug family tripartite tricarboxylate transporter substrate binding protein n=1 Tax=Variovorax guangxiensis TaxID=1775474 RepID=UPI0028626C91|nr:tripartite tricarboxylate transporter substrate binding protein [Variovorax guangxiensis]MDR6858798.1 tripartite-type tricarboxylate transporter receptor subunit TctC [Variovorax guangxiensis]